MYLSPMPLRFTASGPWPECAFAAYAAKDSTQPLNPFRPRAELTRVMGVVVVRDRAPLHAVAAGYLNDSHNTSTAADGDPLSEEDDAEWLADRLIEENDACVRSGTAGALLMDIPGPERSWLFFGWSVQAQAN
ncbi:hypothetical protein [Streptomyces chryseus]